MAADAELDAMQAVLGALVPLDETARQRVITWAAQRLAIQAPAPPRSGPEGAIPSTTQSRAGPTTRDTSAYTTLGELFAAANAKTHGEKVLVVGYWFQTRDGANELDAQRINKELKHLGYGVGDITTAFDELKSKKPALAIQLRKAGTSRQARKKYKITEAGIRAVEAMIVEEG